MEVDAQCIVGDGDGTPIDQQSSSQLRHWPLTTLKTHIIPTRRGHMKSVEELIAEINAARILAACDVNDEIEMPDASVVAAVDYDERRWYILATVVYEVGDRFLGVRGPVSLKSENMGFDDVGVECEAFEMVEVPTVTYKRK